MDIYLCGYFIYLFYYYLDVELLFRCSLVQYNILTDLELFSTHFLAQKLKKSSLLSFQCVQKKIENFYFQWNHFTRTNQTKQQANKQTTTKQHVINF